LPLDPPSFFLLSAISKPLCTTSSPPWHSGSQCMGAEIMEPNDYGLKPLKPRMKSNLSSLKFFSYIFLASDKNWLTHHYKIELSPGELRLKFQNFLALLYQGLATE
jgi:hypothetical protein